MYIYLIAQFVIAVLAGIIIAVRAKKADDVVYGKLDKIGQITNIIMILVYIRLAPLYLGLGLFSCPDYEGFLGIIGWIVTFIICSASLPCGLGLGYSVALRKKGKSKLSFAAQFAGLVSIGISVGLYALFAGNLLSSIN